MTEKDALGTRPKELSEIKSLITPKDVLAAIRAEIATKKQLDEVKADVSSIRQSVERIEVDHGQKIGMLLDGHKLLSEKIDSLVNIVARHEEIIVNRGL